MPKAPLPPEVAELFARPNPAVVAVLRPKGAPMSVATWYLVEDDGTVLLNMDAGRARLDWMRESPQVALTALKEDEWYTHVSVRGPIVRWEHDPVKGLADIDRHRVLAFLDWLQAERGCSAATHNQRLAVIKSLCRYIAVEQPDGTIQVEVLDALDDSWDPSPLASLLADPAVEVIFHAGRQDVALLRRTWRTDVVNIFDTQIAAGFTGRGAQMGYEALLSDVLGERHRWQAVRGYLYELSGDLPAAATAYAQAARRATNVAERDHLVRQAARARAADPNGSTAS